ncbi:hypothetical protein PLICRDRAFT_174608 [Plicaturopsis crispa FD-325 SS-3]|nr:hypothetical protein PLICRDRAFT_174608 [Plicaturopsis crispa FD-325 SS-3]
MTGMRPSQMRFQVVDKSFHIRRGLIVNPLARIKARPISLDIPLVAASIAAAATSQPVSTGLNRAAGSTSTPVSHKTALNDSSAAPTADSTATSTASDNTPAAALPTSTTALTAPSTAPNTEPDTTVGRTGETLMTDLLRPSVVHGEADAQPEYSCKDRPNTLPLAPNSDAPPNPDSATVSSPPVQSGQGPPLASLPAAASTATSSRLHCGTAVAPPSHVSDEPKQNGAIVAPPTDGSNFAADKTLPPTVYPTIPAHTTAASGGSQATKVKKSSKMQPTPGSVTARNLCSIDWCAEHPDGTKADYKVYWDHITPELKKAYTARSKAAKHPLRGPLKLCSGLHSQSTVSPEAPDES